MLYRKLVVEQKLATDAGANYDGDARDAGAFSVFAVPRSGVSLPEVERAVDAIIAGFARTPPSASDLAHVKTQLVASDVFRRDNQLDLATAYGRALAIGRSVADVENWSRSIEAVRAEDVRAAAANALVPRESVSLHLTPGPA